ncbi:MAG: hypothetical protein JWP91_1623 [Fibrobacteres bacterium]|nr:hypothetical protein [Fibrobacterota bacterium]
MRFQKSLFLTAVLTMAGALNPVRGQTCVVWTDTHTKTVEAKPGDNLGSIVQQAASGTTILLAPGTYKVAATLQFTKDDVTMRSKSGNRGDVILDGNGGGTPLQASNFIGEIVAVSANNVTLADFTIRYAKYHGVHAYPPGAKNITGVRMRNLRIYDCAEQQIKINSNGSTPSYWVDLGILECSLIEFVDNSVMEPLGDGFYTGGMDVHGGQDWIVRGNTFRNIQRNGALMEHAVHFWSKSRGTLIEGNRFENNFRAIGLGMKTEPTAVDRKYADGKGDNPYLDHIGGLIRNNVIWNRKGIHQEVGIELMNVSGAEVYNNTVFGEEKPFSDIEYRWPNTTITVKNNLMGHNLNPRDGAKAVLAGNVENAAAAYFKDPVNGDLHLTAKALLAIDKGLKLPTGQVDTDMDGRLRDALPDIGAYEYNLGAPTKSHNPPRKTYLPSTGFGTGLSSILFRNLQGEGGREFRLIDGRMPAL